MRYNQIMENPITLQVDEVVLEARMKRLSDARAVIITHPHPLYGGDMRNGVVMAANNAFQMQAWSTLRFNFRGTGQSTGLHTGGPGEVKDLQAAIDYLRIEGFQQIDLVGYSFGAWIIATWAIHRQSSNHRVWLIAPPVAMMDFREINKIPGLYHVISGSLDEIAPARQIKTLIQQWRANAVFTVIEGADHSFWNKLDALEQTITNTLSS
jgi:alpha/beta superfamily hydrolase